MQELEKKATQAGFARLIGVDRSAVNRMDYLPEGGSFQEWLTVYCERLREIAAGRGGEDQYELTAERARLAHHQANKTELEEQELRGVLVKVEEVVDIWTNSISNCKTRLLGLPNKLTHQILAASDHKVALALFESGIHEALDELANGDISANKQRDADSVDTAA